MISVVHFDVDVDWTRGFTGLTQTMHSQFFAF